MDKIYHKHILIRSEVDNPPLLNQEDYLKTWFRELVSNLRMKLLGGPFCFYVTNPGNVGWTGACVIETSHIAMHCWNERNPALLQLDVYTCGELDPLVVKEALHCWHPIKAEYKIFCRENGIEEISQGSWFSR